MAILAEHLVEARGGRAAVVLLAGAPGSGKTRLLEEFPPVALAAGVIVLRGGASQAEGMPPYLPFLEALGAYLTVAPAGQLREQIGLHGATLAMLLPEISARLGPPPLPHPLGPEQERFRLYEAVAAFLAAIAAREPLALLFDDLQWADAATFDLLVHIAGRLRSAALLVVGAYRAGETAENPAFVRALTELNRRRLLVTLPLQPLEAEESRTLATHLVQGEIAPEVADLLHRHGEGNPFFLEELLRAWVEAGMVVWRDGHWELGSNSQPGRLLPPRVVEAIQMRLERLDPLVVELLRLAAVVGRAFEPALLAQVAKLDVEQVEEKLLAATQAQLVRPEVEGAYLFMHDMVRETLYAQVGRIRRQRLHQAIGEALEAASPRRLVDTAASLSASLAFHFAEAGEVARGVSYALASAERALRASAAVEAMTHYQTAIRLLDRSGETAQPYPEQIPVEMQAMDNNSLFEKQPVTTAAQVVEPITSPDTQTRFHELPLAL